ncbi:hypothetical protein VNO77_04450 [Canavalia gladiata]|uniref:Dof-type domain-containing protein n=1 Tax=Canavalia gladiata TaxID=3824 RepID=A0AAN9MWJ2_CANGL
MSEVKDPAIKLFGRTISLPRIRSDSPAPAPAPASASCPSSSSSPREVSSATQHEAEEPSRKELTSVQQDEDASHQTTEDLKSPTTSSGILENPKTPSAETETSLPKSSTNGEQSETSPSEEKTPKKPDKILPCPRCNSMDTKFCYYNNYNVNQPRHFCKNCQRYWTAGGTMRNVPVGAGRRKNKNTPAAQYRHIMVPEALQGGKLNVPNGLHNGVLGNGAAVLTFGPDSPLCHTMSSVLNIAERAQNCVPNGFHATEPNTFDDRGDHSIGMSVTTTSTSSERRSHNGSHESVDKRIEALPPQLPYFPNSPWPYPWNSTMPPPTFCPPGYPLSFYTPPAIWSCMPPSWNMPCISPQSSVNNSISAPSSATNLPTLGKHSRDGNIITPSNSHKEKPDIEHNSSGNNMLIPKTLRIDDPSEAAKSSMWSKLGIKNDKANSLNGGSLFKPFPSSKGNDDMNHMVETSSVLQANPAALSRSLTFHERT